MTPAARRRALGAAALSLAVLAAAPVAAVGLEGEAAADRRVAAALGSGADQVAGIRRDVHSFLEASVDADLRLRHGLALAAGLGLRRDFTGYNFALARWGGGGTGVVLPLAVGWDGPRAYVALGPAFVADGRGGRFRGGLVPLGTLRVRIGRQDGWHFAARLLETLPTAAGAGHIAARLDLAPPPRGQHRLRAGVYASLAEATAGVALSDEWPAAFLPAPVRFFRLGCHLGSAVFALRPELTCAAAAVF